MNGVGDDQHVMTFGQLLVEEIAFDDIDPRAFRLAGKALARDSAGARQFEQRRSKCRVAT